MTDVTRMLSAIEHGDSTAAEQLLPLVYDELRRLAAHKLAHEKPGLAPSGASPRRQATAGPTATRGEEKILRMSEGICPRVSQGGVTSAV
jgi:hypothetical protein